MLNHPQMSILGLVTDTAGLLAWFQVRCGLHRGAILLFFVLGRGLSRIETLIA